LYCAFLGVAYDSYQPGVKKFPVNEVGETMFWPVMFSLLLLSSDSAIAQEVAAHGSDPWYKIAAGVIAVPGAAIGLLVSWNMMRKTRLETKKLEIEIAEKQHAMSQPSSPSEKLELLASPLSDNRRALLIVIRYVLLDITLRLWDFVPTVVSFVGSAVVDSLILIVGPQGLNQATSSYQAYVPLMAVGPSAIRAALGIVYWLIVFGFGWPLFKDTCAFLNIPVKSLLDLPRIGWTRTSSS
jgi:hypothetical protein